MTGYILGRLAQEDLIDIRDYYLREAGYRVARQMLVEFVEAFRAIARNPGTGHRREDLAGERTVLFWPMRDYLIIYKAGTAPVEVVTIVRGSRDIPALLRHRESLK